MFDADSRVILCNQRYIDLYGLAAAIDQTRHEPARGRRRRIAPASLTATPSATAPTCSAPSARRRRSNEVVTMPHGRTIVGGQRAICRAAAGSRRIRTSPRSGAASPRSASCSTTIRCRCGYGTTPRFASSRSTRRRWSNTATTASSSFPDASRHQTVTRIGRSLERIVHWRRTQVARGHTSQHSQGGRQR